MLTFLDNSNSPRLRNKLNRFFYRLRKALKFAKKGDIGYAYIIMIVLGILGIIFVIIIFKGGLGELGAKIAAIGAQAQP